MGPAHVPVSRVLAGPSLARGFFLAAFLCVTATVAVAAEGQGAAGQADQIAFDIPAQPLATALEAFSASSGYQVLMSDAGAATLRSAAVKGILGPRAALTQMLADTGMAMRFTAPRAVVLVPGARPAFMPAGRPSPADEARYEAMLQEDVIRALCRDAATRPGGYRAALDLWLAASGGVERVELLGTTGDRDHDRRILAALRPIVSAPPPPGLAQPTTVLIVPAALAAGRACPAGPGAP